MSARVVNLRLEPWRSLPADSVIYMGRAGKGRENRHGNPFSGRDPSVLSRYRHYLEQRLKTDEAYRELCFRDLDDPRPLACFCVGENGEGFCHAKVWADLVTEARRAHARTE